jgi:hypothetical protein
VTFSRRCSRSDPRHVEPPHLTPSPRLRPRSALACKCRRDAFFPWNTHAEMEHFAVLVAGLRKILLAKLVTLRVTLRVCDFLSNL